MKKYQDLANKFGGLAAPLLTSGDTSKNNRNGLSQQTPQLTGAKELAEAQSKLRNQELEAVANQQKAIVDDVKKNINERLIANDVYYATLIEMAIIEGKGLAEVEEQQSQASIRRVRDLQRRKAEILSGKGSMSAEQKTKALADIELQLKDEEQKQEAHFVNMLSIESKYETDTNKLLSDAINSRLNITKTGNEEWLKVQNDAFAEAKQTQLIAYMTDEALLRKQFDAKLITRKQYDQQLRELQHKQHIIELEAEVEQGQRLLQNINLTSEQQLKIKEKLLKDEKALVDARAQTTSPKGRKPSGRITDSVATLFGGADFMKSDLDLQQRYLQSFYDAAVNLARNAADQILAINQQRIQAEQAELDKQQENKRAAFQFELEVINITSKSEQDKQERILQLRAQQGASEAVYEQKRRQLAQQQARFQRTAAMASAISNTAVGVTKALAELGPLAAVVIPLIVASGAAQIATIASAPIPQYKDGTGNHKGGKFIAGDGNEIE